MLRHSTKSGLLSGHSSKQLLRSSVPARCFSVSAPRCEEERGEIHEAPAPNADESKKSMEEALKRAKETLKTPPKKLGKSAWDSSTIEVQTKSKLKKKAEGRATAAVDQILKVAEKADKSRNVPSKKTNIKRPSGNDPPRKSNIVRPAKPSSSIIRRTQTTAPIKPARPPLRAAYQPPPSHAPGGLPVITTPLPSRKRDPYQASAGLTQKLEADKVTVKDTKVEPVNIKDQHPVRMLAHGLDRVLFNPGVYYLQDPRSRIFNFDPYLQQIMPVDEFDFDAISSFISSSKDKNLERIARENGKRYVGSTSSMTSSLSHMHFLLSNWRPLNFDNISRSFDAQHTNFTEITRSPSSVFLRYKGDGVYAIDSDKEFDTESVFSLLGQSLEKLLTLPPAVFEQYRRSKSHELDQAERDRPETYHYSTYGDFLMRSQLDAQDPRLPGSGMFDLKTRAVVSVRMDQENLELGAGYQIKSLTGSWESFEREYFDLIRSAFLKYSLQARMGRMDGIFVTYHNTEKIFGFQYVPMEELDQGLHGEAGEPGTSIGDQEFRLSLELMNKLLNYATEKFPEQSLRINFETTSGTLPMTYFFAEPVTEEEITKIQEGDVAEVKSYLDEITGQLRKPPVKETTAAKSSPLDAAVSDILTTAETSTPEPEPEPVVPTELQLDADTISGESPVSPESLGTTLPAGLSEDAAVQSALDAISADHASTTSIERGTIFANPGDNLSPVTTTTTTTTTSPTTASDEKPLLGLTLKIQNYMNDRPVSRVSHLKPTDVWTVAYDIGQLPAKRARETWKEVQRRRKDLLYKGEAAANAANPLAPRKARDVKEEEERKDVSGEEARLTMREREREMERAERQREHQERQNGYLMMLRRLSMQGREWEKREVEKDRGRPRVLFRSLSEGLVGREREVWEAERLWGLKKEVEGKEKEEKKGQELD